MHSILTEGQPMSEAVSSKQPRLLRQVLTEKRPVDRVRRMLSDLWGFEDDKLRVIHDGIQGQHVAKVIVELKTDPPRVVYHGTRVDGQVIEGVLTGPSWADVEFHPGRWCEHLFGVFQARQLATQSEEQQKAEADRRERDARYGPVDDAEFFKAG